MCNMFGSHDIVDFGAKALLCILAVVFGLGVLTTVIAVVALKWFNIL
jgi:hypothetical protein